MDYNKLSAPGRIRILHLEDSEDDAHLILRMLLADGMSCTHLRVDSQDAFLTALQNEEIDVILSDVALPGFNGLSALALSRQLFPHIPFIFLSGAIGEEDAVSCLHKGADDYMLKERLTRLPSAIHRAIDEARGRTARHEAEQALCQSEKRLAAIFQLSPIPISMSTVAEDRLIDMNNYYLDFFGYSREEMTGRRVFDLGLWDSFDEWTRATRLLHRNGCVRDFECRLRLKTKDVRIVLLSMEHLHLEHGSELITMFTDITQRKLAERERAYLFEQVRSGHERLQHLSHRLLDVQEAERRHIARELHDDIGQALTALKMNVKRVQRPIERQGSDSLDDSIQIIDGLLQQVRNLSLALRPCLLDDQGLVAAVCWLLNCQAERAGWHSELTTDEIIPRLPSVIETTCYRVVQEALTNVARHAMAKHVRVTLQIREGALDICIGDDGVGFDVTSALQRAAQGKSVGLLSLDERIRLLSGQIMVRSHAGHGTEIHCRVPLSQDRISMELALEHPVR